MSNKQNYIATAAGVATLLTLTGMSVLSPARADGDAVRLVAQANAGIQIDGSWVRASIGNSDVTAAYMTLRNPGQQPDRLLKASSPAAGRVELHTTIEDGGVMRMRPVNAIDVAAGGTATLAPGGLHVMLMDVPKPLQNGTQVELTLQFERAGTVKVTIPVRAAAPGR